MNSDGFRANIKSFAGQAALFKQFVENTLLNYQGTQAYDTAQKKFYARLGNALNGNTSQKIMQEDFIAARENINNRLWPTKEKVGRPLHSIRNSKVMWAYLFSKITRRLLEQVGACDPFYSDESQKELSGTYNGHAIHFEFPPTDTRIRNRNPHDFSIFFSDKL